MYIPIHNLRTFRSKRFQIFYSIHRLVPLQDRKFPCKEKSCNKRFTRLSHMTRHYQLAHKGIKYNCDQCVLGFSYESGLKHHKKLNHNPNPDEGKKLKQSKINKKTETAESCDCDICSKTMSSKAVLSRHYELKHYPNKSSCPYGCPDKIETESAWIAHLQECKSEKMVSFFL